MTRERETAVKRRVSGMILALALGGPMAAAAADERVIDDFTTGPTGASPVTTRATGVWWKTQLGDPGHLLGGIRCTALNVTGNALGRLATLEVIDGPGGYAVVDTGVGVWHQGLFFYGFDESCNGAPLHEDLSAFAGLRIDFDAVDLATTGAVVVWTGSGIGSIAMGAPAGADVTMYLPFDGFGPAVDWSDVHHIAVVVQTGGVVAAHDYVIKGIRAVTAP
jgi:hypothetical protein